MAVQNPSEDIHAGSFGRYLQSIREANGISLAAVAAETRIRADILEMIEEENHQGLPDEVYVLGFLRAYARAIGADGDEAVKRYQARMRIMKKVSDVEKALEHSSRRFWPRLVLSFGLLIGLMFGSIYGLSFCQNRSAFQPVLATPERPVSDLETDDLQRVADQKNSPESINATVVEYLLKIKALEETWIKVTIDSHQPAEYNLNPGDYIELKATSRFDLMIGNAGGVELALNDESIPIAGKQGQTINLQLP